VSRLYPFPADLLSRELARHPAAENVWCQEEPQNMGAWAFIDRRLERLLTQIGADADRALYVGRPEAAATAVGSMKRHAEEQADLLARALVR